MKTTDPIVNLVLERIKAGAFTEDESKEMSDALYAFRTESDPEVGNKMLLDLQHTALGLMEIDAAKEIRRVPAGHCAVYGNRSWYPDRADADKERGRLPIGYCPCQSDPSYHDWERRKNVGDTPAAVRAALGDAFTVGPPTRRPKDL